MNAIRREMRPVWRWNRVRVSTVRTINFNPSLLRPTRIRIYEFCSRVCLCSLRFVSCRNLKSKNETRLDRTNITSQNLQVHELIIRNSRTQQVKFKSEFYKWQVGYNCRIRRQIVTFFLFFHLSIHQSYRSVNYRTSGAVSWKVL